MVGVDVLEAARPVVDAALFVVRADDQDAADRVGESADRLRDPLLVAFVETPLAKLAQLRGSTLEVQVVGLGAGALEPFQQRWKSAVAEVFEDGPGVGQQVHGAGHPPC